jgi:hypothetical protein
MPIDVAKVIAFSKAATPQAFCAAMILRCTAWHQVPAGTLPDDDAALAAMTGLDIETWATIREQALCGFTRFPDGQDGKSSVRLCHPEIVHKARDCTEKLAWKEERRANDAARQRRCYERTENTHAEPPSNGATPPHNGTDPPYGMSPAAYQRFLDRKAREVREAELAEEADNTFDLRRKRYLVDLTKKTNRRIGRRPDMPPPWKFVGAPGFDWNSRMLTVDDWANVLRHFGSRGEWAPSLGPPPGKLGCQLPNDVAWRFGYDVVTPSGRLGGPTDGTFGIVSRS